ncbi:MAG TPA: hypothetical protein VHB79_14570 [Polyangiaceae bacterium]|nr:hypothetical protein [Polyangiaceae bacterium]
MIEPNTPLRLRRQSGRWTLEVTKLVTIDRHVLRPERRQVSGTESVVRHLKERCAPALVREALDLIVGEDDGFDRSFELDGDHWIQLAEEDRDDAPGHASLLATVNELRAELTTMRALHEALRSRLAVLERRSLQLPPAASDYTRASTRGPARREPGASLRPAARLRSEAYGEPEPALPLAEDRTQAAVAPPAPPAAVPAAPAAPTPAEPPTPPALAMPSQADVTTCLRQLLGTDPELRAEKGNLPQDLDAFFVSRIVDANDREVGAILFDLAGGAELGGRLLGLPAATIAEQAKSEPSADLLDAMNEVINNLGGFVNRANPELRTRVRALEKFSVQEYDWLPKNAGRIGVTTKTGGRLWLATR